MKISALLPLLFAPKTLDQAKGTLATAATTLESVSAMFTAAGLDMEQMLAVGQDALKAHIASVSANDAELATAQSNVKDLEAKLTAAKARATACEALLATIGATADTKPEAFAGLLETHVKTSAAAELAKTGHAPVGHVATAGAAGTVVIPGANASRHEHYAYMATLPEKEQHAYYSKHLRAAKQ